MTLRICQSVPLFGNMQAASLPINNTVWQALILTNCKTSAAQESAAAEYLSLGCNRVPSPFFWLRSRPAPG